MVAEEREPHGSAQHRGREKGTESRGILKDGYSRGLGVGWVWWAKSLPPRDAHVLIPGTCDYVTLHGKKDQIRLN